MIKPTVGRVVWYVGSGEGIPQSDQVCAALIAYVHSDTLVNLVVFDRNGIPHSRMNVTLVHEGAQSGPYCTWMPYQKAVAAGEIAPVKHADPTEEKPVS